MRKGKVKKRISVLMAMMLLAAMLLGGCGKSVDESSDDNSQTSSSESGNAESGSREKVTVTVSSISWEPDPADVYLTQYIEEELGIILDWKLYSNEEFSSQLSLLLSTDSLPDLIVGANLGKTDVNKYGAEGYFLNIAEYSDVMPNMQGDYGRKSFVGRVSKG